MKSRLALHALAVGAFVACVSVAQADGFTADDTHQAIQNAAEATGVPAWRLTRIVACETGHTFNPYVVGDRGASLGVVQLNRYGNAWPVFFAYYTDPHDPYQAVQFLAEALRGDYRGLGWWTWSCR